MVKEISWDILLFTPLLLIGIKTINFLFRFIGMPIIAVTVLYYFFDFLYNCGIMTRSF